MLSIEFKNGIFSAKRDGVSLGQARNLESLIENASDQQFPDEVKFAGAEVIRALMGELRDTHGQIATREGS